MKIFKSRPIVGVLLLAVSATAFGVMYLRQPKFGALPQGDRLALIEHSPNYRDGAVSYTHLTLPTILLV